MSNLSKLWIDSELTKQIKLKVEMQKAFDGLKDKSTPYAAGMLKMLDVREAIISAIYKERGQA